MFACIVTNIAFTMFLLALLEVKEVYRVPTSDTVLLRLTPALHGVDGLQVLDDAPPLLGVRQRREERVVRPKQLRTGPSAHRIRHLRTARLTMRALPATRSATPRAAGASRAYDGARPTTSLTNPSSSGPYATASK